MSRRAHGNDSARLIVTLIDARSKELRAAALYRLIGDRDRDPKRRELFRRLADVEQGHAERFGRRIEELGGSVVSNRGSVGPVDRLAARWLGTQSMLRRMEAEEERNMAAFTAHAGVVAGDADTRALFEDIEREEESHTRLLRSADAGGSPTSRLQTLLGREKWHVTTGSWIGDAIYGVNDGLGAVFGIVSGMAGATSGSSRPVVVAGLVGTLASALSMGSSAFLAARAEREVHHAETQRERREIEEDPEHEIEELALIYEIKGFSPQDARRAAETIAAQPELFLQTMEQEELGISAKAMPNPGVSLASAMISTAIGGAIPVLPFLFAGGIRAVIWSAVIATVAHFVVGVGKSFVTARNWIVSGLEMTAVGVAMGVVTYLIGTVLHIG